MDWREKVMWIGLGLVVISLGLEILDVWPILVAHLSTANWITAALIHLAPLIILIEAYRNAPKGARAQVQVLLATVFVIMSWSYDFSLMGKIGR